MTCPRCLQSTHGKADDEDPYGALCAAAELGRLFLVVKELCQTAAAVLDAQQRSIALVVAAGYGRIDVVQYLCNLPAAWCVEPGYDDGAALAAAAERGDLRIVQYLCELPLERGVKPGGHNNAALIRAAQHGHVQVVKYLCELSLHRGVERVASGNFALARAAQHGHLQVVEYLCDLPLVRGIQPDAWGNEPVRLAAHSGHLQVVQTLCQLPQARGVDASACDNDALWGVIFNSSNACVDRVPLRACMGVVTCLYDVSSVTKVARALPPWQLANDFATAIFDDWSDDEGDVTMPPSAVDVDLRILLCLVQTLPGGDQWLDHDGQFTEENLPLITCMASHRVGHALVELVRRQRVWRRRRTLWLLRALRDSNRAQPRSRDSTASAMTC